MGFPAFRTSFCYPLAVAFGSFAATVCGSVKGVTLLSEGACGTAPFPRCSSPCHEGLGLSCSCPAAPSSCRGCRCAALVLMVQFFASLES